MLHGVGSDGRDLISLAPLWSQSLPNAMFTSPDAPQRCDMAPMGYQWFSLQDRNPQKLLSGIKETAPALIDFIDEQLSLHGLPYSRLALVGFSQGSMMSMYVAPRLKEKIAGVLAYSGALLWEDEGQKHKPPMHLIHGESDDVVPIASWRYAKKTFQDNGFAVSGHTTKGLGHSIDNDGLESGLAFLKSVL